MLSTHRPAVEDEADDDGPASALLLVPRMGSCGRCSPPSMAMGGTEEVEVVGWVEGSSLLEEVTGGWPARLLANGTVDRLSSHVSDVSGVAPSCSIGSRPSAGAVWRVSAASICPSGGAIEQTGDVRCPTPGWGIIGLGFIG